MNRRLLASTAVAAAALLAFPLGAMAQTPPTPPSTFYGEATGATAGQGVVAIVINGSTSTVCGSGVVTTDNSKSVYVVDVVSQEQRAGCGASGRQVRFYFTPTSSATGGRLANETGTWAQGPRNQNLTQGSPLTVVRPAPMVASDGTN